MKVTKFIPLLTAIIVVGFGGFILVDNASAGGIGICVTPDGRNVPCAPPPTPTPTQPPPPSPEELERQRKERESNEAFDKGVECGKRGDYDCAIGHYKEALRLNSDNKAARDNLGSVLNRKANKFYEQGDWNKAIEYYKEALEDKPKDKVIQDNLRGAQAAAEEERRLKAEEAKRERKRDEAKAKINKMLDDLAKDFGASKPPGTSTGPLDFPEAPSSDALVFVGPGESLFSKGSKSSAPVDLTFVDPGKPKVVDPRVVKGKMTPEEARIARVVDSKVRSSVLLGALMAGQGDYDKALSYLREASKLKPDDLGIKKAISYTLYLRDKKSGMVASPKASALLDALEYGRGNWQASMNYLRDWYKMDTKNLPVRDALNFAEGLSGYGLPTEELPLPPGYKVPLEKGGVHDLTIKKAMQSFSAGEYEKAYNYYKKAHEQNPEDLGIRDMVNFSEGLWAAQQSIE